MMSNTQLLLHDGREVAIGELRLPDDAGQRAAMTMSDTDYVFVSHTDRDGVKEEIVRPTAWFLRTKLGVTSFFDDGGGMIAGNTTMQELATNAYKCTHALLILSPSYRQRRFCVMELNTFMRRLREGDGIQVLPALWKMNNLDGYHEHVQDLVWLVNCRTLNPVDYIVESLWPALARRFGRPEITPEEMEEHLAEYVKQIRGRRHSVPVEFEIFVRRHRRQRKQLGNQIRGRRHSVPVEFETLVRRHARQQTPLGNQIRRDIERNSRRLDPNPDAADTEFRTNRLTFAAIGIVVYFALYGHLAKENDNRVGGTFNWTLELDKYLFKFTLVSFLTVAMTLWVVNPILESFRIVRELQVVRVALKVAQDACSSSLEALFSVAILSLLNLAFMKLVAQAPSYFRLSVAIPASSFTAAFAVFASSVALLSIATLLLELAAILLIFQSATGCPFCAEPISNLALLVSNVAGSIANRRVLMDVFWAGLLTVAVIICLL